MQAAADNGHKRHTKQTWELLPAVCCASGLSGSCAHADVVVAEFHREKSMHAGCSHTVGKGGNAERQWRILPGVCCASGLSGSPGQGC